jgi:hypothetical protein
MRRAVARGRMFPQSFSTDRRYGRLSVKTIGLFPLMWANCDDQGRLCGDPEEIKYAVCPNIDFITKKDIPDILKELEDNHLISCYDTLKSAVVQMLDWWEVNQKMQWAWPSEYSPQEGWQDHLRYKKGAHEMAVLNWPPLEKTSVSGETSFSSHLNEESYSGELMQASHLNTSGESAGSSHLGDARPSGEYFRDIPSRTPLKTKTINKRVRVRGNSPERSGELSTSASPSLSSKGVKGKTFDILSENFRMRWGIRVPPDYLDTKPREPSAREIAQLRDLAKEIETAGGCTDEMIKQAFDEAAAQGSPKLNVSYVRAVLLDWLGVERKHHGA